MRRNPQDRLYFPLSRTYRQVATGAQIALTAAALALALGAMATHYSLVFRPSQADFTRASLPYEPWYLVQEEASPAMESRVPADGEEAAVGEAGHTDSPPAAVPVQSVEPHRPNLTPQPGISYSPSDLAERIEAHLMSKGAETSKGDLAARAQALAEAYASSTEAGISAYPFPADLERSVLEQGWLWDLQEGCEPQVYVKFPAGQLDRMGCGLADVPRGKPFGVGVALVQNRQTGQGSVIAVVWDNR